MLSNLGIHLCGGELNHLLIFSITKKTEKAGKKQISLGTSHRSNRRQSYNTHTVKLQKGIQRFCNKLGLFSDENSDYVLNTNALAYLCKSAEKML